MARSALIGMNKRISAVPAALAFEVREVGGAIQVCLPGVG
jgi:hypothetical protein